MRSNWIITAKALTYRLFAGSITFVGSWKLTGSAETGGLFTLALMGFHFLQYWIHEKIWSWIETKINTEK